MSLDTHMSLRATDCELLVQGKTGGADWYSG